MQQDNKTRDILSEMREEFFKFREESGKVRGFPQRLKAMVSTGLQRGFTQQEIANAAGMSLSAVKLWRKQNESRSLLPVELKIIDSRSENKNLIHSQSHPDQALRARIIFRSGIQVSIPVLALTPALIISLNGDVI